MSHTFHDARPSPRRHRRSGPSARPRAMKFGAALALAVGAVGVLGVVDAVTGGPAAERARSVRVPTGPPLVVAADTVRPYRPLGQILRERGFAGSEYVSIVDGVRRYRNPRRLPPGADVRFTARVPERPHRIVLGLDRDRSVRLFRAGAGWSSRLDSVPVRQDTLLVGGVIRTTPWEAALVGDTARLYPGERAEIIVRLSQIYAWQIDFLRGIREGDAFRAMVERDVRPDGSVRSARVLAAEFVNGGRRLPAVRFDAPGEPVEYYDAAGEATRKAFLRAPLEFGRLTSGFSRSRYHPILHRNRAHLGIDYGAPRGTPVLATGAGVVRRAGRWGGYGIVVEIRHDDLRYRTRYAHLSRLARGTRRGARVRQGEVIGYVGSTGLSTAPHVHYEFLVSGRRRNPTRVDLPPGEPVPDRFRAEYMGVMEERLSHLRGLRVPGAGVSGAALADD